MQSSVTSIGATSCQFDGTCESPVDECGNTRTCGRGVATYVSSTTRVKDDGRQDAASRPAILPAERGRRSTRRRWRGCRGGFDGAQSGH